MPYEGGSRSTYSCATMRYLVDARREVTVPAGIVLWNWGGGQIWFRLPREDERIPDVPIATARPFLEGAKAQIEGWLRRRELPYSGAPVEAFSDQWWEQIRGLMQFSVRLSRAQPIDCQHPEVEIEALFEALVQPRVGARARTKRIDGAVTRALGADLTARFQRGRAIAGFHGRGRSRCFAWRQTIVTW
jgi:hypothetical protein